MDSNKRQRAEDLVTACGAIGHVAKVYEQKAKRMLESEAVAQIEGVISEAARALQHNAEMVVRLRDRE